MEQCVSIAKADRGADMTEFLTDHQRHTLGELQKFGWELHAVTCNGRGGHHAAVRAHDGSDSAVIREDGLLAEF